MVDRLQIKIEFNRIQDRLLLRISEKQGQTSCMEYRLWLTRRFVNIFIKATDKLIEDELAKDMQVSPDTIDMMKKFQHEAALSQADFSTSYDAEGANCKVFGGGPLLVTTLKIQKKTKGKYVLSLLNDKNLGAHLTADTALIHSLQKMLWDSINNAEWNKPLLQTTKEKHNTLGSSKFIS